MKKKSIATKAIMLLLVASCTSVNTKDALRETPTSTSVAKNVIFMIVDGMGFNHIKAARIYNGQTPFSYEQFACKTKVTTCAKEGADKDGRCIEYSSAVTDSAAAATAIATGVKVNNGVVSRSLPGGHKDIETILEVFKERNKSTGIIATKLFTDATPAAFASHANDRSMTKKILRDMFQDVRPNVIFGADTSLHRDYAKASKSPYDMVFTASDMKELASRISSGKPCEGPNCPFIYGGFGEHDMIAGVFKEKEGLPLEINSPSTFEENKVPHLSEMTDAALKILNKNQNGFFLMVESSMPDIISHHNTQIDGTEGAPRAISVLIREMLEVENTVKVLKDFVAKNPDTLVIVTADHETGGLVIEDDKTACLGEKGCVPSVRWTSLKYEPTKKSLSRHTGVDVPLYAIGMGSNRFCTERINNTDIGRLALAE